MLHAPNWPRVKRRGFQDFGILIPDNLGTRHCKRSQRLLDPKERAVADGIAHQTGDARVIFRDGHVGHVGKTCCEVGIPTRKILCEKRPPPAESYSKVRSWV